MMNILLKLYPRCPLVFRLLIFRENGLLKKNSSWFGGDGDDEESEDDDDDERRQKKEESALTFDSIIPQRNLLFIQDTDAGGLGRAIRKSDNKERLFIGQTHQTLFDPATGKPNPDSDSWEGLLELADETGHASPNKITYLYENAAWKRDNFPAWKSDPPPFNKEIAVSKIREAEDGWSGDTDQLFYSSYEVYQILRKLEEDDREPFDLFQTFTYIIVRTPGDGDDIYWAIQGPTENSYKGRRMGGQKALKYQSSPKTIFKVMAQLLQGGGGKKKKKKKKKRKKRRKGGGGGGRSAQLNWNTTMGYVKAFKEITEATLDEIAAGLEEEKAGQREEGAEGLSSASAEDEDFHLLKNAASRRFFARQFPKFLIVSKRIGDQGQALACLRSDLFPDNDFADSAVNVFVTLDKLAAAAALLYGVDALVFTSQKGPVEGYPATTFIIYKKSLEDKGETLEVERQRIIDLFGGQEDQIIEKVEEKLSETDAIKVSLIATRQTIMADITSLVTRLNAALEEEVDNVNEVYGNLLRFKDGDDENIIQKIMLWISKYSLYEKLSEIDIRGN